VVLVTLSLKEGLYGFLVKRVRLRR
jgi:hypothetical protein